MREEPKAEMYERSSSGATPEQVNAAREKFNQQRQSKNALTKTWEQAAAMVKGVGILPESPHFTEMFALALEQVLNTPEPRKCKKLDVVWGDGEYEPNKESQEEKPADVSLLRRVRAVLLGYAPDDLRDYVTRAGAVTMPQAVRLVCERLRGAQIRTNELDETLPVMDAGVSTARGVAYMQKEAMLKALESDKPFASRYDEKTVRVDGVVYSIDNHGIYRVIDGASIVNDREFAAPIAAYLKDHGLTAENIKSVTYDQKEQTVHYRWEIYIASFRVIDGAWIGGHVDGWNVPPLWMPNFEDRKSSVWTEENPRTNPNLCARCGELLDKGRVAICQSCEPDAED
jgi:hypothetical protein